MNQLTIALPDNEIDLQLFPVERVMPIIKRLTRQSPDISEVIESIGDAQDEIGHHYGCEYLTLAVVEPDGSCFLPLHARRVLGAYGGGYGSSLTSTLWEPGLSIAGFDYSTPPGRQYVADQVGGFTCWRDAGLLQLMHTGKSLNYRRTENGLHFSQYRTLQTVHELARYVVVHYDAELTDERGYPLVSQKDALACAHYWNWQRLQADVFGGIPVPPLTMQMATENMNIYVAQARIGEGISEKGWENIMRSAASWDRTSYRYGLPSMGQPTTARGQRPLSVADGY